MNFSKSAPCIYFRNNKPNYFILIKCDEKHYLIIINILKDYHRTELRENIFDGRFYGKEHRVQKHSDEVPVDDFIFIITNLMNAIICSLVKKTIGGMSCRDSNSHIGWQEQSFSLWTPPYNRRMTSFVNNSDWNLRQSEQQLEHIAVHLLDTNALFFNMFFFKSNLAVHRF